MYHIMIMMMIMMIMMMMVLFVRGCESTLAVLSDLLASEYCYYYYLERNYFETFFSMISRVYGILASM
jgi:hypothetical protein